MSRPIAAAAVVSLVALAFAGPVHAEDRPPLPPEVEKIYQDKPVIELVTMGIGSLIWERHGHIALCVRYDESREDCYNYGVGDFGHPLDMGWGFLRAAGSFWVEKRPISDMLWIYHHTDRTIWVQPLPLTQDQKIQIINKLEHDILLENRAYAYDHFWDNCTTRVRDIIDAAIGGKLAALREPSDGKTFRDLAREGFYGMPVPLLITDFAMGRVTDRVPTYNERMFLPQYLREAVTKLWGIQPIAIYTRKGPPPSTDDASARGWLALVILLLTSPAWLTRLIGRLQRTGLALAVLPYVLLGTAVVFVAAVCPLPYLRWNENCLVLLPLDLLLLILPARPRQLYALGRLAMLATILVLSLVGVLAQPLLTVLLWPAIPLAVVGLWPSPPRPALP